jgi:two-component system OmpR family sensor kinase
MYSSLRARLSGLPLRTRLIAALVGLVTVVVLIIGVASEYAFSQISLRQLDQQVLSGAKAVAHQVDDRHHAGEPDHDGPGPGPPDGTVTAKIVDGQVQSATLSDRLLTDADLPTDDYAAIRSVPRDGRAHTRTLAAGEYRLVAMPSQANTSVVVVGQPLADLREMQYLLAAIEIGVVLVALGLASLLGTFMVRRTLRPLDRMTATARRVAELPLDRGEVALSVRVPEQDTDPRTEVGQVGAALNRMLGHVAGALSARQASETRVRHFVADASHELRTPLAAIRGYAELTRRDRDQVPPDVAHALGRVESEAARMTVLVEDLLLLARIDSGRPLEREPVDLSRLIIDAVSDAHVAGPEHRWRLDLPEQEVTVTGDRVRLHQVIANLLVNGRTHTPPGTTVTASIGVDGDRAVLAVTDDGPGIPADLQPEVFDRFARGDSSRSRQAGSTGLGLAIVAAVVEAHGGTVEVESAPGRTRFTVRLPLAGTTEFAEASAGNAAVD